MRIDEAQREVRTTYVGGAVGQAVSGILWLLAAALGTWWGSKPAILCLVLGGMLIFPLTQLALKLGGRKASLGPDNPLRFLAMQVAFIVPLTLPVAGGAALYRLDWFFPACMVLVGAHYLPFAFLYGMPQFLPLGACMILSGLSLALWLPAGFAAGAWFTGALLLAFAVWIRWSGAWRAA